MRLLLALLFAVLAGCMLAPHKIDIQQGNYVDQEMVAKLKPDMTRSQVRFILGTPLVADVFHPNRWDYVYLIGKAGDVRRQRKITVVFEGDKLKFIDGDVVASENLTQRTGRDRQPLTRGLCRVRFTRLPMTPQRIAIAGSTGRMGRALIEALAQAGDFDSRPPWSAPTTGFSARTPANWWARRAACAISADLERSLAGCDVLVDFTRPEERSRISRLAAAAASAW